MARNEEGSGRVSRAGAALHVESLVPTIVYQMAKVLGLLPVLGVDSESGGLSEMKRATLSEFLGFDVPPIARANETANTEIGEVYREFVQAIRFESGLPP